MNVIAPGTVLRRPSQSARPAGREGLRHRDIAGNVRASFDIYNVFNANAVSREQYGFNPGAGAQYLTPLGLQPGRLFKISLQYNY